MLFKKWKKKPQIPGIVDYIPKNIALEHKRNAQEMISVSKEKYESRPREQPNGIEAKYEQYVEEQKKTADRV